MGDLEKKLFELLHELPQKRNEFEELQQRYNAELLQKRELQTKLEGLETEMQTLRTQLVLVNKALHRCEENLSGSRDTAVKHRLNLEAANKTIDAIKDQSTKLHLENVKLKKQIEELERDMKAESFFRESCTTKQKKAQTTTESLVTQMRNLEKDYRDLERHSNEAILKCNKSKLMMELKDTTITQLKSKIEELSLQVINLTTDNSKLKENLESEKPVEQHYVKEILQEWQTSQNEMKSRTTNYEKDSETLQQALNNALNAQMRFQNLEAAANERVRELEEKLLDSKKTKKKMERDCGIQTEFNISMDVACETTPMETASVTTQTDSDPSQVSNEDEITMPTEEKCVQNEQSIPTYSFSSSLTNLASSCKVSLGDLMSKYQQEKDKQLSFIDNLNESQPS